MLMRRVSAKDKIPNGLLRGAAVAGLVSGLAAASLGGVPNADATCLGIFGISINDGSGGHCSSNLFSFALGLGDGTSATAGGFLNAAIAVGSGDVNAIAGDGPLDSLNLALNLGNATDGATSTVSVGSGTDLLPSNFNLAANLGGNANDQGDGSGPQDMDISVGGGYLNVALNVIGNRNTVSAGGRGNFLSFAVNAGGPFSFPNGSDNIVTATNSLSAALNSQTFLGESCSEAKCGNTVTANGPLSLVVAAGVVRKLVEGGVGTTSAGANRFITLANSFNSGDFEDNPNLPDANVSSLRFAPTTFAGGSSNGSGGGQQSGSLTKGGNQLSASLKKLSAGVQKALGGLGKKKQDSEPKSDSND